MAMDFAKAYKHPLWQKKRLEILEAHEYRCTNCGDEEKTLHVHHGRYDRGKCPWEYPNETLFCLCEDCHAKFQEQQNEIKNSFLDFLTCLTIWN